MTKYETLRKILNHVLTYIKWLLFGLPKFKIGDKVIVYRNLLLKSDDSYEATVTVIMDSRHVEIKVGNWLMGGPTYKMRKIIRLIE